MKKSAIKNRNEGKPRVCRICSLKDFGGVLLGRDMAEVFKEGHVYSAFNIMGEIVIKDLGPHATDCDVMNEEIGHYACSGVVMLTKDEYERQIELGGF